MVMVTKRGISMVTKVTGAEESNGKGGKSNGDGNKETRTRPSGSKNNDNEELLLNLGVK